MDQERHEALGRLVQADVNPVSESPEPGAPAEQVEQLLRLYQGYKGDNPGVVYVRIEEVIENLGLLLRSVREGS